MSRGLISPGHVEEHSPQPGNSSAELVTGRHDDEIMHSLDSAYPSGCSRGVGTRP